MRRLIARAAYGQDVVFERHFILGVDQAGRARQRADVVNESLADGLGKLIMPEALGICDLGKTMPTRTTPGFLGWAWRQLGDSLSR